jgi:hypothetical protein
LSSRDGRLLFTNAAHIFENYQNVFAECVPPFLCDEDIRGFVRWPHNVMERPEEKNESNDNVSRLREGGIGSVG